MTTVGILLAAGSSRRFSGGNKLLAAYRGKPLVAHAADALRGAGFQALVAVVASEGIAAELGGFRIVPPDGDDGQAASLRAGCAAARDLGADQIVVALADMPLVTPGLLRAVAALGVSGVACALGGDRPMPPAAFPANSFGSLLALAGDAGARGLLAAVPEDRRIAAEGLLEDVDTVSDLARLP